MWAFLAGGTEDQNRSVVLLGEEFERCGVFEWVDGILLSKFLSERDPQLVEVGEGVLNDLRAGCAAQEERGFGILCRLRSFFVLGSLAARIARFSGVVSTDIN